MNHKAKKSLGQNFLKSRPMAEAVARAAEIGPDDIVLEIGPGKGILTEAILAKAKKLIAIEKDEALAELLKEKFKEEIKAGKLEIIAGDFLEFDMDTPLIRGAGGVDSAQFKVAANIPYYITGMIIKKLLSGAVKPSTVAILVQKEVAQRIVAHDKKESILSISVKAYGTPKLETKVPARFFSPAPKVDSAILSIKNISGKNFKNIEAEERFFEIVKAGFAHKRKVLISNLQQTTDNLQNRKYNLQHLEKIFEDLKIDRKIRAEDISLETWLHLARTLLAS